VTAAAPHEEPTDAGRRDGGFGLYVHWPFCVSKCPYCDFNSHVADRVDETAWEAALLRELDHYGAETAGRTLDTVFFGGGTPSLMPPRIADALLDRAAAHWTIADDLEVTLEANPSSIEAGKFRDFRAAGVNRVSIGVQSFDPAALRFLGRAHDAQAARDAISVAERTFSRFSFDLIYALPGQTAAGWRAALREALARAGDHLSLYQLTIEKGTAFYGAHRRGAFVLPDDDLAVDLYELTAEETDRAGLPAYEISNYARPGAECRHNLVYWQGGDYVGIGPGAHGRLRVAGVRRATAQFPGPENWLAAVAEKGHGTRESAIVPVPEQVEEFLLTGLRLTAGIDRRQFERLTGRALEDSIDPAAASLLAGAGLIELDAQGLRATAEGRQRLNALIGRLVV
tara:strand:+ start:130 stop:1326 length:1197 start_codon:yes stop_codon:yes gene_type:complete